jgi:hypothetical protein
MSNLQGNGSTSEYSNRRLPPGRNSRPWTMVAAAAVVIVVGLGYVYENGWLNTWGVTEHRAAATDGPAASTKTVSPTPTTPPMTPAAAPKP